MIRDEDNFAKKITGYLDLGTADLRAGTGYRLKQARAQALARLGAPALAAESRLAHALAGGSAAGGSGVRWGAWLVFGILLIAAAATLGYQQWQAYQQAREIEEIDVQILTSELPIDAYLDRGFQTWLTRYQP